MEGVIFVAAILLLAFVGLYLAGSRKSAQNSSAGVLLPGVTVTSTPLLTERDVVLYNLIRLAVQDHYLVFVQVPLWSFVSVEAMGKGRAQALNHMALKRVDFVLMHPGSRQVDQVIQFEDTSPRPRQAERQRVIEAVLQAAGIKLVVLRPQTAYTVPALVALLGLAPEE